MVGMGRIKPNPTDASDILWLVLGKERRWKKAHAIVSRLPATRGSKKFMIEWGFGKLKGRKLGTVTATSPAFMVGERMDDLIADEIEEMLESIAWDIKNSVKKP
jgi:hypothetical protein